MVKLRVLRHFHSVQPQAYQLLLHEVVRQVGAPAAHQIQDEAVMGQGFTEELADGLNGVIVNVYQQSRLLVEQGVVGLVLSLEELWAERVFSFLFHDGMPIVSKYAFRG